MPYVLRCRPVYRSRHCSRYRPRFRQNFQSRWDALAEIRRQRRRAYTPEEMKIRIEPILKRRRMSGEIR